MCSQDILYLVSDNKIPFQEYAEHIDLRSRPILKMHSFIHISLNGDCKTKDLLMYGK